MGKKKKWILIILSLVGPFLIVGADYIFLRAVMTNVWFNYFVILVSSFIPLYAVQYFKINRYLRIVLGVLAVLLYFFLLIAWVIGLGFTIYNEAL